MNKRNSAPHSWVEVRKEFIKQIGGSLWCRFFNTSALKQIRIEMGINKWLEKNQDKEGSVPIQAWLLDDIE